ncbi:MAG: hypothetical protein ACRD0D_07295 [Acidimicrobiales bacterium]
MGPEPLFTAPEEERLGHSSIMVTMVVYGHLFPSLNEAMTERLDEVFRDARRPTGEKPAETVVPIR